MSNLFDNQVLEEIKQDFIKIIVKIRNSQNGGINKYLQQSLYNSFLKTECGKFLIQNKLTEKKTKDDIYQSLLTQIPKSRGERNISLWNMYENEIRNSGHIKQYLEYLKLHFIQNNNKFLFDEKEKNMKSHFIKYTTKRLLALFCYIRIFENSEKLSTLADLYFCIFHKQLKQRDHKKSSETIQNFDELSTRSTDFPLQFFPEPEVNQQLQEEETSQKSETKLPKDSKELKDNKKKQQKFIRTQTNKAAKQDVTTPKQEKVQIKKVPVIEAKKEDVVVNQQIVEQKSEKIQLEKCEQLIEKQPVGEKSYNQYTNVLPINGQKQPDNSNSSDANNQNPPSYLANSKEYTIKENDFVFWFQFKGLQAGNDIFDDDIFYNSIFSKKSQQIDTNHFTIESFNLRY